MNIFDKYIQLHRVVCDLDVDFKEFWGRSLFFDDDTDKVVYVDGKVPFDNFEEHLSYIYENHNDEYNRTYNPQTNTYKDTEDIYTIYPAKRTTLYHGTSLENFFKILEVGYLDPMNKELLNQRGIDDIEYNLVFFSEEPFVCVRYGKSGGINIAAKRKLESEYVILELDTSELDTYNIKREEYCVWGKVDISHIKSIYAYDSESDRYKTIPFMIPEINLYDKYKNKILPEYYLQGIHGVSHIKRVLYLTLKIAEHEDITGEDLDILANGAVFHDIGRENDSRDNGHGIASYDKTLKLGLIGDNPYLRFIIECHCIDDILAYELLNDEVYQVEDKDKAIRLYKILKDADSLDRVRLGDFNEDYLRLDYSKGLANTASDLLNKNL